MRRTLLLLTTVVFGLAPAFSRTETTPVSAPVVASAATPAPVTPKAFSDSEKAGIEDIIKNYLTKDHPEVMMQAMQELQRRDQESAQTKTQDALKADADKVFSDPNSPIGGNPKGSVVMVEFFDYNCGYCKMSEPDTEKILKEDKDVKFIYKDFPILGPVSVEAAKAALASVKQNGYVKFHDALMAKKDHLSEDVIYQVAKDVGLNIEKLKKDAASDDVAAQIKANQALGRAIGVRGTPMFIIGSQVYPGALQYEQMKVAVDHAHEEVKNKK